MVHGVRRRYFDLKVSGEDVSHTVFPYFRGAYRAYAVHENMTILIVKLYEIGVVHYTL
jgi:hypothetical protein